MQTITVTRKIDKAKKRALFFIGNRQVAYVEQNKALPDGHYRAGVNCFAPSTNELFSYDRGFYNSAERVSSFICDEFRREFNIGIKFVGDLTAAKLVDKMVESDALSGFSENMKAKSFNQIRNQKGRLKLILDSRGGLDSERSILIDKIFCKYMRNIYDYLDYKFGKSWDVTPDGEEKLNIQVPASIYTGRVRQICYTNYK